MNDLHLAASNGDVATVHTLLQKGAEVDYPDDNGVTALMMASEEGHQPTVQLLLRRGANPNLATKFGQTALMEAVRGKHALVVETLLEQGANADLQDKWGFNALHLVTGDVRETSASSLQIATALLAHGANPNLDNGQGRTPLSSAAGNGHVEIAAALLKAGADPRLGSQGVDSGWTPLHGAARAGNPHLVIELLERGAKPQVKEETGWTPLQFTLQRQNEECIQLLVEYDNSIPQIHRASINGDVAKIQSSASPDTIDSLDTAGVTPLYWATKAGHEKATIALLEAGASPDLADAQGDTPLMNASNLHSLEAVQRLIAHGANVDLQRIDGWTALMRCSTGSGDDGVSVCQTLLDAGASLSARGRGGVSALSIAAYYGQSEIVRLLLTHGADVNERAEDGQTPLMAAVQHGHHSTIQGLIEHGADLNAQTNDGRNASNYADWWCDPCGTAELLLAAGADPALVK